jgi:hypothetical protein
MPPPSLLKMKVLLYPKMYFLPNHQLTIFPEFSSARDENMSRYTRDFMKIINIFLPSCFFLMGRAVTFYMTTNMLAQDIIFTVLGYVPLFIAAKTSFY